MSTKPYACKCCGYVNADMEYDYLKEKRMSKVYRNYYSEILIDVEDGLISLEDLQELIEDLESIINEK